jgi:hypothetical protein
MPAMKTIRALQTGDARWRNVMPPLVPLDDAGQARLKAAVGAFASSQTVAA